MRKYHDGILDPLRQVPHTILTSFVASVALIFATRGTAARAQDVPKQVLLQIQALIERNDLPAARDAALVAQRQHPTDGGLQNLLGVIAAQSRQPREAEAYFKLAIREESALVSPYLNLGRIYLESPGEFEQAESRAERLYMQALKLDPKSDEAHIQLGSIYERRQDFRQALAQADAVSRDRAHSTVVLTLRCGSAAGTGDRQQTDAAAAELKLDPDLQDSDIMSMTDGLRKGRRADLIEMFLSKLESRQQLTASELEMLGLAQDANGDSQKARETLERAFAASPGSTGLLASLAHVAEHQGDGPAALGYLAHARDLAPTNAALAYEFAQVCVRNQLLGEAHNAMERALALAPENAEYNLTMGKVTALSQDPLRALPYLEKYQALRPNDPAGLLLIGVVYYKVKDYEAAEPWLRRAGSSQSTAPDAHLYLGSGFRQQGKVEQARKELVTSAKLNGQEAETHSELGLLALRTKDLRVAEVELQKAIALEPANYTANFGLLQLYAQTNDPRRKQQLARFQEIELDNEALNRRAMRVIEVNR